jgi:GNAT superfamily N-acetyltransferase
MDQSLNDRDWKKVAKIELEKILKDDPVLNAYGWSKDLNENSIFWLYRGDVALIQSLKQRLYPAFPGILQIYCRRDRGIVWIDIDRLPIQDKSLLVYTSPQLRVVSRKFQRKTKIAMERYFLPRMPVNHPCQAKIRLANRRDWKDLCGLYRTSNMKFNESFLGMGPIAMARDGQGKCVGAYGVHLYEPGKRIAILGHLFVVPSMRGKGLGKGLISYLCGKLSEKETRMVCDIEKENAVSINTHRTVGFEKYPAQSKIILMTA